MVIFELKGVVAAPDLTEPQAFKNASLQMIIDQTSLFAKYLKKIATHSSFHV